MLEIHSQVYIAVDSIKLCFCSFHKGEILSFQLLEEAKVLFSVQVGPSFIIDDKIIKYSSVPNIFKYVNYLGERELTVNYGILFKNLEFYT